MIWGRCYIQRIRMVSEFSKNYINSSGRGSTFVECNIKTKQISLYPAILHKKMASTSSNVENKQDKKQNKLAFEKSPYLLQHATNPVDWYPWGEEALEKARREDKLIFLSVGYSTCHWCHVMEKESFENPDIAKIMNRYFVNIKVDREERPDIDKVYMTFIQSISGHGGWPMSVFLTPTLIPLTGGTYFPPTDKYGQPGFARILEGIALKWIQNKHEFLNSGTKVLKLLKESVETKTQIEGDDPQLECAYICVKQLIDQFETRFGGFSSAPKFPQPVNFNLLFLMYARDPTGEMGKKCLDMCIHTLTKMANGGIHDHVGQGFARYSVDGKWHVPHFEKMLYDQGQLLRSYAEAYLASNDPFFAEIANDIVSYVVRDLRHPEGGFYSAEDADSFPTHKCTEKKEGAFYVWSYDEIQTLLSKNVSTKENTTLSDIFCFHFNVKPAGNVEQKQDPHEELKGKNVLIVFGSICETAEHFKLSIDIVKSYLQESVNILFEERKKRPRPHLDYKILTAWNGLMISGLSHVASALNDSNCMNYAEDVAKFIEQYLFDKENKILLRSCYRGEGNQILQTSVSIKAFQVDYAFVIQGLLDLYEITFNTHWLEFAEKLQGIQDHLFWDDQNGGYFSTIEDDSSLILRLKDEQDGAEPSGNSVACTNLVKLAAYLDRTELSDKASKLLRFFQNTLLKLPIACPELVTALINHIDSTTQIYIVGEKGAEDTKNLLRVVRERLIPGKIIILVDKNNSENVLYRKNDIIRNMKQQGGCATAYVCHHRACSLPVTNPEELALLLDKSSISS